MKTKLTKLTFSLLVGLIATPIIHAADSVPVTVDNFVRAESDLYIGSGAKDAGGTGKFFHHRDVTPVEKQPFVSLFIGLRD